MGLLNLLSCLALCFLPHVVYYHATPLTEFAVAGTVFEAVLFQLLTSSIKVVLLACLLPGTELTKHDIWQDLAQVLVTLIDVLGLYLALTKKWIQKSISNEHRFQAVALGWAFGDSLLKRFLPMWLTGFSPEFQVENLIEAIRSNIFLIHSLSFASIGTLVFNRRMFEGPLAALLKIMLLLLTLLPFILTTVEIWKGWSSFQSLGFEAIVSIVLASVCWELYKNAKKNKSRQD